MKAIFIDSFNRRIGYVEVNSWKDYSKIIGYGCELFCIGTNLTNGDCLFVDDEGLLRENIKHCFLFDGQLFAGNGLIIGSKANGDECDVESDELDIAKRVQFPPRGYGLSEEAKEKIVKEGFKITVW